MIVRVGFPSIVAFAVSMSLCGSASAQAASSNDTGSSGNAGSSHSAGTSGSSNNMYPGGTSGSSGSASGSSGSGRSQSHCPPASSGAHGSSGQGSSGSYGSSGSSGGGHSYGTSGSSGSCSGSSGSGGSHSNWSSSDDTGYGGSSGGGGSSGAGSSGSPQSSGSSGWGWSGGTSGSSGSKSGSSGSGHSHSEPKCCPNNTPAAWDNYGNGTAGCHGVPSLTASPPVIDTTILIRVGNGGSATTMCALVWGLAPDGTFVPFLGGDLNVGNVINVDSLTVPAGGLDIPCFIADDCGAVGLQIYSQTICLDPCGPEGFALSQGMRLTIGV